MVFRHILHRRLFDDDRIHLMRRCRRGQNRVIDKTATLQRNEIRIVAVVHGQRVDARRVALQHECRRIGVHMQRQSQRTDSRAGVQHRVAANTPNSQFFGSRHGGKCLRCSIICGFVQRHADNDRFLLATHGIVAIACHQRHHQPAQAEYANKLFHRFHTNTNNSAADLRFFGCVQLSEAA